MLLSDDDADSTRAQSPETLVTVSRRPYLNFWKFKVASKFWRPWQVADCMVAINDVNAEQPSAANRSVRQGKSNMAPEQGAESATDSGFTTKEEESATNGGTKKKKQYVKFVDVNDSKGLVILFGWAGCQDRYLEKYAQIYTNSGFSTARYIVPVMKVRSYDSYRIFAKRTFDEIFTSRETYSNSTIPIVFHCFSMNGSSLFSALWDVFTEIEEKGRTYKQRIAGLIFDSAPAFTTPLQTAEAIATASHGPSYSLRKEFTKALIFTGFSFHRGVSWLRSLVDENHYAKTYSYYHLLSIPDLPKRHLYIYGPGDTICTEDSIEAFINTMNERDLTTVRLRLEDSLHCQHFRAHPETYTIACTKFVSEGLEDENFGESVAENGVMKKEENNGTVN